MIKPLLKVQLLAILLLYFNNWSTYAIKEDGVTKAINNARKLVFTYPDDAISILDSLQSLKPITELEQIEILQLKASAYAAQYNSNEAISHAKEALQLAEKINSAEWQVIMLSFIGNQYYIINVKDEVVSYLDRAEAVMTASSLNDTMNYIKGNIYFLKAINFKENLDGDIAIKYFKKAIEVFHDVQNKKTSRNIGISLIQLGYIYDAQNVLDSAYLCYNEALVLAKENEYQDIYMYAQLGHANILSSKGLYKDAIQKTTQIFDSIGLPSDPALLSEIYETLAQNYLAIDNISSYKLYSGKSDSIVHQMKEQEQLVIDNLIFENITVSLNEIQNYQKHHLAYSIILWILIIFLSGFVVVIVWKHYR